MKRNFLVLALLVMGLSSGFALAQSRDHWDHEDRRDHRDHRDDRDHRDHRDDRDHRDHRDDRDHRDHRDDRDHRDHRDDRDHRDGRDHRGDWDGRWDNHRDDRWDDRWSDRRGRFSASCRAALVTRSGRPVRFFEESATGRTRFEARNYACRRALYKCERAERITDWLPFGNLSCRVQRGFGF